MEECSSTPRVNSSSRVQPIIDDPNHSTETNGDHTGAVDEFNPLDAWLPITESRNGTTLTATFHLLCSAIGIQLLTLPIALISLGWLWGILCLTIAFSWQLYTRWLLLNLHESTPITSVRYSRFLHLSLVAFGEKLGKLLVIFPTMYLSGGTCVLYIIMGGTVMKIFLISTCGESPLAGAECFLVFICAATLVAQFFPNLNSLASVSLIASLTALAYSTLLWTFPLTNHTPIMNDVKTNSVLVAKTATEIRNAFTGFEMLALAFRGHNLVLEIQGTLPSSQKESSRKSMWRAVRISSILSVVCVYPVVIVGYWAYGDKIGLDGGVVAAIAESTSKKHVIGGVCLLILLNYVCAFQIYAMPTFDNLERIYVSKNNRACSRLVRGAIKVFLGGLTYFIAVSFPFLPRLAAFIGAIGFPVTFVYPCFMWLAIKKPPRYSRMWCLNVGLGSLGAALAFAFLAAALWSLIDNGLKANFYHP